MSRALRADVRNPVLRLPSMKALQALDQPSKDALAAVLADLRRDSAEQAEKCWRTHKPPMAAYWKAVSVYAGHISRAMRTT